MDNALKISWDSDAQKKFERLIEKVPVFMRSIAQKKVSDKAESIAKKDNRAVISEKDMVDAFFEATPFGFHGPMKTDMESLKIDYVKYGHPK